MFSFGARCLQSYAKSCLTWRKACCSRRSSIVIGLTCRRGHSLPDRRQRTVLCTSSSRSTGYRPTFVPSLNERPHGQILWPLSASPDGLTSVTTCDQGILRGKGSSARLSLTESPSPEDRCEGNTPNECPPRAHLRSV